VPCRYGDANDSEFLDELNLDKVKLVIVNVTDHSTNNLIVNHVRYQNKKAVIIASIRSDNTEDALELYEAGANYVMMPHHVSSERVSKLIDKHGFKQSEFKDLKEKHTHSLLHENV
jgi:Trk K+ transport system NAD-binding subunit